MWRTPDGIRRLQDAEARLVCAAAVALYEQLKARGEPAQIGARAFDRLTLDQQMFAVLAVAQRLTDEFRPFPLEAWSEAAVFAIFECVHAEVAFEIGASEDPDEKPIYTWRRLVRDALIDGWTNNSVPAVDSMDIREWDFGVVDLSRCILWDLDFLDEADEQSGSFRGYSETEPPAWTPLQQGNLLNLLAQIKGEPGRLAA